MPLYEYACEECDEQAEILVGANERPVCPACGSSKLRKLLSIVAAPTRDSAAGNRPDSRGSCGPGCGCH